MVSIDSLRFNIRKNGHNLLAHVEVVLKIKFVYVQDLFTVASFVISNGSAMMLMMFVQW